MVSPDSFRGIFWSDQARREVAQFEEDVKRFDEVIRAAEWALSQAPDAFEQVPGTSVRIIKLKAGRGGERLRIAYQYDDTDVTVLSVGVREQHEAPEG